MYRAPIMSASRNMKLFPLRHRALRVASRNSGGCVLSSPLVGAAAPSPCASVDGIPLLSSGCGACGSCAGRILWRQGSSRMKDLAVIDTSAATTMWPSPWHDGDGAKAFCASKALHLLQERRVRHPASYRMAAPHETQALRQAYDAFGIFGGCDQGVPALVRQAVVPARALVVADLHFVRRANGRVLNPRLATVVWRYTRDSCALTQDPQDDCR